MAKQRQTGFGVIGIIAIIFSLIVVCLAGWRIWGASQSNNNQISSGNNASSSSPTNQSNTATQDTYSNWKTYCDSPHEVCFKYPADWILTDNSKNDYSSLIIANPDKTMNILYASIDNRDAADVPYYTAAIKDVAQDYKIVGGFIADAPASYIPSYQIVDNSFTTALQTGKTTIMVNSPRFTINQKTTGHIIITPTSNSFSEDQAKSWFSSKDGRLGMQIAQSFTINNH